MSRNSGLLFSSALCTCELGDACNYCTVYVVTEIETNIFAIGQTPHTDVSLGIQNICFRLRQRNMTIFLLKEQTVRIVPNACRIYLRHHALELNCPRMLWVLARSAGEEF